MTDGDLGGIAASDWQRIRAVLARERSIADAVLYGSRAKGCHRPGSDIDLCLRGGADLDLTVLVRVLGALDDLLLPQRCDVAVWSAITEPALHDHIRRVGLTVYQREQLAVPQEVHP